jgi:hypothetical protein
MNNMNEEKGIIEKVKMKSAEVIAGALVRQANSGTRFSATLFVSEPQAPVELLKETRN